MSDVTNRNEEARIAQEQYENEMVNEQPVSTNVNTEHVPVVTEQKPKVREGWTTTDGKFWRFENYHNLPTE